MHKLYILCIIFLIIIIIYINVLKVEVEVEAFTPKINQMYRPYVRRGRIHYDTFMNYFTIDKVIVNLKKWNMY